MITVNFKPRGRPINNLPDSMELDLATTTESLYTRIAIHTSLSRNRLRLTKASDGTVLVTKTEDGKFQTLKETGLSERSHVFVKDLGVQIAWRTVFLVEYLGPLLIHPLFLFYLRPLIYSSSQFNPLAYFPGLLDPFVARSLPPPTTTQYIICLLVVLHFIKREYETLFVHRFSASTMPALNIFKNSAHYWILSGFNLAYFLYMPRDSATIAGWWPQALDPETNPTVLYLAVGLWLFSEVSNYHAHVTLRNLRPVDGSTRRRIPQGYGFDLVTCPNYLFETLAWFAITILSGGNLAAILFLAVATGQMALWAKKKEVRYRKEFGSAYQKKSAMFPGLW
ncbi:hypothetical protein K440DRAFT_591842 [Wilcoxina mikolae CBS 423.85]|nr:hypothetical protein K440DRAFT_591842 [Wilcoxina mikolae CBS 423.85]